MNLDAGMASVIVAAIAAFGALANTFMTQKQSRQISETHKQVTVNHHSSEVPTVLDRIDDVKTLVLKLGTDLNGLGRDFNDHVAHSNEMDLRLMEVESEVRRSR